ncbi:MAG TPA: site-specific integrase, partial [Planctomycetaceae bacterium]|nr:site-specific integrase [Planctomycetaceae bacterium]
MQSAVSAFLQYLRIERNCSPLTIKSYSEDLAGILEYLRDFAGGIPALDQVSVTELRGYVAYMHE